MAEQIKKKYRANKKTINLLAFVILFGIMLILFIYFGTKDWELDVEPIPDNIHFINDYPSINKSNVFIYKKIDEIKEFIKNGTGVVFFCTPNSDWCHSYAEILNDTAKEYGLKEIYYYDIYMDRMKGNQNYKDILELLDSYLLKDDEDNKKLYLPALFVVKNGQLVGYNYDTAITIGNETAISYWNIDKIIEIKSKLKELYKEIIVIEDVIDIEGDIQNG